jgi:hypothetical protein
MTAALRAPLDGFVPVRSLNAVQVVRAVYEAQSRGALAGVLDALEEGVEWEVYAPEAVPFAGLHRGRAGVTRYLSERDRALEDVDETMTEFVGSHDRVVAIGRLRARIRGTDLHFETATTHVWDLRDGHVTRFRGFFDSATVAAAFEAARSREEASEADFG